MVGVKPCVMRNECRERQDELCDSIAIDGDVYIRTVRTFLQVACRLT